MPDTDYSLFALASLRRILAHRKETLATSERMVSWLWFPDSEQKIVSEQWMDEAASENRRYNMVVCSKPEELIAEGLREWYSGRIVFISHHFADDASSASVSEADELEIIFNGLARNWREATGGFSLNMRRYTHETYQVLMHTLEKEKVEDVVPLILRELQQRPDMWFEALKSLTKENPAKESKTFNEAVKAWLDWGKRKSYIN